MHRWLRSPRDHANLSHLLPKARDERLRRMVTRKHFFGSMLVSFGITLLVSICGTVVMHIAGVYGRLHWGLVHLGIAGVSGLVAEEVFERVAFNRELDRCPRLPCPKCGYSLDAHLEQTIAPTCPECGAKATEMLP